MKKKDISEQMKARYFFLNLKCYIFYIWNDLGVLKLM